MAQALPMHLRTRLVAARRPCASNTVKYSAPGVRRPAIRRSFSSRVSFLIAAS